MRRVTGSTMLSMLSAVVLLSFSAACSDSEGPVEDLGPDTRADSGPDLNPVDTRDDGGDAADVPIDNPDGADGADAADAVDAVDAADLPGDTADQVDAPGSLAEETVHFDTATFQYPEGIARRGDGFTYVGLAALGSVVRVADADNAVTPYGQIGASAPLPGGGSYVIVGMTFDSAGALYVALASFNPAPPAGGDPITPGIYRIPAGGGTGTLFASDANLRFPNGVAFDTAGTTLYITNSAGSIYTTTQAAGIVATQWVADALLEGSATDCGSTLPFRIGANGIAITATDVYVSNTEKGSIVRIPFGAAGAAGTPVNLIQDCAQLAGSDGITLDTDGSILSANNGQNKIQRITTGGTPTVTTVDSGPVYDAPASLAVDAAAVPKALYITNFAVEGLLGGQVGAGPGLLKLELP